MSLSIDSGDNSEREVVEFIPIPLLIVNFKWTDKNIPHQEIRFYPFIPRTNLKKHQLSPTAQRANYKMFNYIDIHKIPHFVLYSK